MRGRRRHARAVNVDLLLRIRSQKKGGDRSIERDLGFSRLLDFTLIISCYKDPTTCPPGAYKMSSRQQECFPCPANSVAEEEGSVVCVCEEDHFRTPLDTPSAPSLVVYPSFTLHPVVLVPPQSSSHPPLCLTCTHFPQSVSHRLSFVLHLLLIAPFLCLIPNLHLSFALNDRLHHLLPADPISSSHTSRRLPTPLLSLTEFHSPPVKTHCQADGGRSVQGSPIDPCMENSLLI
ncbi:unnamed protein product [Pleuronectes platessa]|uniref:Tyrosine-protein kinase ephrin type A/B receptor-like domain-containing protein n=1 Tax=Pleuronectes platessa TaxID=8262 RepID=A0A9N7YM53_PLEPL|nr:unnamed protein product [Pleuronectes platessa]